VYEEEEPAKPTLDSLDEELLVLFLLYGIPHRAMHFLLNVLHSPELPVSKSLYLLTTKDGKKKILKYSMGAGDFAYLGIASNIAYLLKNNLLNESNQRAGSGPLMQLPGLEFPKCIPPDYMHLVCLGTVRKLFHFLFSTDDGRRCKLRPGEITALSEEIERVAPFTPSQFQRRPRRIDQELAHFKASE
uniref:Anaphase-promoting complex subunit 1 n=1 Tax=Macrostomum lignano TaxID=282301 RepID=A0A1I8GEG8_9PLAT